MKTIFLPWRGEFGMMLMKWVRRVHGHKGENKIVCTLRGTEPLFPSASGFYYDWEVVPDDKRNCELLRSGENHQYLTNLQAKLAKSYPDAEFVYPIFDRARPDPADRQFNFIPKPTITRGLSVDIVIGPRWRNYGTGRNFGHWQEIVSEFVSWGLSVGAIGARETSIPDIRDVTHRSWEYDVLDAGVELLRNCKLAVMSCSGPAHLAVLCGAPLKVICAHPGKSVDGKDRWYMPEMQSFATNHCEPIPYAWDNPKAIYAAVREFLALSRSDAFEKVPPFGR